LEGGSSGWENFSSLGIVRRAEEGREDMRSEDNV
jgi:hypothetical protein